ncbi:unnamed protein product [Thelazia callipaeda]|uniref:ACB domain-containing protein n=1 Tax=Thelazia callipaeda TaxID=103827 RepID=A0A0N5CPY7_THECL|nr:unnamed protein product [Thelazia callipaeda]
MNFETSAEEMRRLDVKLNDYEQLQLYGLYKQAIHGDIPSPNDYPPPQFNDIWNLNKYDAWLKNKGKNRKQCEEEYVEIAQTMIKKYGRKIARCKWNCEVWTADY